MIRGTLKGSNHLPDTGFISTLKRPDASIPGSQRHGSGLVQHNRVRFRGRSQAAASRTAIPIRAYAPGHHHGSRHSQTEPGQAITSTATVLAAQSPRPHPQRSEDPATEGETQHNGDKNFAIRSAKTCAGAGTLCLPDKTHDSQTLSSPWHAQARSLPSPIGSSLRQPYHRLARDRQTHPHNGDSSTPENRFNHAVCRNPLARPRRIGLPAKAIRPRLSGAAFVVHQVCVPAMPAPATLAVLRLAPASSRLRG